MRLSLSIGFLFFVFVASFVAQEIKPRLLIISLDGFRHGYLNEHHLPHLETFCSEGIRTKNGMEPTFTTMTYPNHISLATGMYEEDHGIIHNVFYDRLLEKKISMISDDEGQWADPKVEPIWITATKQQKEVAVFFWPACQYAFQGIRPANYTPVYTTKVTFREKIDQAIAFFDKTTTDLVMMYHYEPDRQGHYYGPRSKELRDTLRRLDKDIEYLMNRVRNELMDRLNIIILSDHGMSQIDQVIRPISDGFIDRSLMEVEPLNGALYSVYALPGKIDQVIHQLQKIPNVTVYRREDVPERFHYSAATHRLGDVIVLADREGQFFSENLDFLGKGNHGWDNTLPNMQAIFMARGPAFRSNTEIDSLKNVDVYHMICRILQLTPNPHANAGSLNDLEGIFLNEQDEVLNLNATRSDAFFVSSSFLLHLLLLILQFLQ